MKKKAAAILNEIWHFISSRQLLLNCAGMLGLLLVLMVVFFWAAARYTLHGQTEKVPGYLKLTFEQAKTQAEKDDFQLIVMDSVFDKKGIPGLIIGQLPQEGDEVKSGRKIYVTINSYSPPVVPITYNQVIGRPRTFVARSFRKMGLEITKETPRECKAVNTIVELRMNGAVLLKEADPSRGESKPTQPIKIPKASKLELCYCKGDIRENPEVPELTCKYYVDAIQDIEDAGYTIGRVKWSIEEGTDTLNAYICIQRPMPGEQAGRGTAIDLTLCVEDPCQ